MQETRSEGELQTLDIREIIVHPAYQVRQKLDVGTVARYATMVRNEKQLPPITVGLVTPDEPGRGRPSELLRSVPEGALVLLDGFHRVEAHRAANQHSIAANVITTTRKGALGIVATANLSHGLPLKPREVRFAFRAYVRAGLHRDAQGGLKSLRGIAKELGPDHKTIRAWFEQDYPKIARQYGGKDIVQRGSRDDDIGEPDRFYSALREALADGVKGAAMMTPEERGELLQLTGTLAYTLRSLGANKPDF
jgi:hypothetical protein